LLAERNGAALDQLVALTQYRSAQTKKPGREFRPGFELKGAY
jgi:hypothetical protein